ncbi:MAG: hypothetical protein M0Z30_12610 [Actinomycetota bacterium]|nr:hypothetical protein [Actinomycetota bacterium]
MTQLPGLPSAHSFCSVRPKPVGGFIVVLCKGPAEVLEFHQLTIEGGRRVAVASFEEIGGTTDQRSAGTADVSQGDRSVITIAEGRRSIDTLCSDDVSTEAQRLASYLEGDYERLAKCSACSHRILVSGCLPK